MRHLCITAAVIIALAAALPLHGAAAPSPAPTVSATASSTQNLGAGTFKGVTPCADCPGIKMTITLRSDGDYILHRVYLGRPASFDEHGTWSYDARRALLTLTPDKGATELFSVSFTPTLHMLDAAGHPLPSQLQSTLTQEKAPAPALAGTGWALTELGGKPFAAAEQHPVTMQFDAGGGRVSGSGGCNRYSGPYVENGDTLTFGALASTKMMCANITGEDAYFAMLTKVASFVRSGEQLTLYDDRGAVLARFGYEK